MPIAHIALLVRAGLVGEKSIQERENIIIMNENENEIVIDSRIVTIHFAFESPVYSITLPAHALKAAVLKYFEKSESECVVSADKYHKPLTNEQTLERG